MSIGHSRGRTFCTFTPAAGTPRRHTNGLHGHALQGASRRTSARYRAAPGIASMHLGQEEEGEGVYGPNGEKPGGGVGLFGQE